MGMNHYLKTGKKITVTCYACGHKHREDETYHIGKSSMGRYYTLHSDPRNGLAEWNDWECFIKKTLENGGCIVDEEDRPMTFDELKASVMRTNFKRPKDFKYTIGEAANPYGDVFGKKGLIYSKDAKLGKDGLYVLLDADFS